MSVLHTKTDNITDWTQADLNAQIAAGNFPAGTTLADIVLPSDWNAAHTVSITNSDVATGAAIDATKIANGSISNTEYQFLDGVAAPIQTQINALAAAGYVVGPASATDNAIARFDLATGKVIQNSGATVDDSGNLTATNFTGSSSGTNTGDQTNITGNAGTATKLQTARTINGAAFDGTANITITATPTTVGNLTDTGTDGIVITGGTGAVIGSGTSIAQHVADSTHSGYLSSTDWTTFNGKSTVTPSALTKTDDTNVTLTLGGTPATALLQAASLTLGWTGTLGLSRGGTASNLSATGGTSQFLKQTSVGAAITVGQLAASDLTNGTTGMGAAVLAGSPTITTAVLGSSTATTQSPGDNSTKLATTAYVQAAVFGTTPVGACKYATTAALTATYNNGASGVGATLTGVALGALTVDGVTPSVADRILVKNQDSTFQNGIYVVTTVGNVGVAYVLTRASDYNQSTDIDIGDTTFISAGSTLANTTWTQNGTEDPVVGTDPITFTQTAGHGSYTSGNGIIITGTSIAIDTAITVDKTTTQTLSNKTFVGPALGTPVSGVATNLTGTATALNIGGNAATATKWETARNLAGNSVDGSANVPFANKFIAQGTTDAGLSGAQFLGALTTGLVKNTTTTGVLSIATAGTDYQAPISLTTTGTSGAATFVSNTLNIPNYAATVPSGTSIQTQSTTSGTVFTTAGTSFVAITGLSVAITPASTSSKILVRAVINFAATPGTGGGAAFQLMRGATAIAVGTPVGSRPGSTSAPGPAANTSGTLNFQNCYVLEFLDSPATTSATTYSVDVTSGGVSPPTVSVNASGTDSNTATFYRTVSSITAQEIK